MQSIQLSPLNKKTEEENQNKNKPAPPNRHYSLPNPTYKANQSLDLFFIHHSSSYPYNLTYSKRVPSKPSGSSERS